jgi:hypothetical protein
VTDGNRRFVYLGSFEGGLPSTFEIPEEPRRKIEAGLDAERAEAERVRAAKAADIERARGTKKARVMRHLRKAMTLLGYGRLR